MKRNQNPGPAREDKGGHRVSEKAEGQPAAKEDYEPLYRQIALWGLSLGRPFTTQELADAFGLTLTKAGGMLHYICGLGPEKVRVKITYRRGGTPMKKQVIGSVEILSMAKHRSAVGRYSRRRPPAAIPITLNDLWRALSQKGEKNDH